MTSDCLHYLKVTVLPPEINVTLNQYSTLQLLSVLPSALRNHLDSTIRTHILAAYP